MSLSTAVARSTKYGIEEVKMRILDPKYGQVMVNNSVLTDTTTVIYYSYLTDSSAGLLMGRGK